MKVIKGNDHREVCVLYSMLFSDVSLEGIFPTFQFPTETIFREIFGTASFFPANVVNRQRKSTASCLSVRDPLTLGILRETPP